MKRGGDLDQFWRQELAGKPRPVIVVQDNTFDGTDSITICAFTTDDTDAPLFQLSVASSDRNGLRAHCSLMVDKVTTVPKAKLGEGIGRLGDTDLQRLNRAMLVFLGLAGSSKASDDA